MSIAILGAAWGDEGKGHITHHFSKNYDWVVRFNGGANAGHTIYRNNKKYIHNLLPSVDFRVPTVRSYLGSGMVIDLEKLVQEVNTANEDFPEVGKRIYVDMNAFIVESKHKELDKANNAHIGSTNRGIGPAYMDKIGRRGMRIGDLFSGAADQYYCDFISQLVSKGVNFVNLLEVKPDMNPDRILFEGAQGVLLDINHGIYPFVSCSDCTVSGIYANGFHFAPPREVYGVVKCYTTKVGEGPFPTEIFGEEAEKLRELGKEYGATTGRPRRIGWLDLPALKYACDVSGINSLIMTKLDILAGLDKVPVCKTYDQPPVGPKSFFKAQPNYTDLPGWKSASRDYKHEVFCGHQKDFEPAVFNLLKETYSITGRVTSFVSCGTGTKDIHQIYNYR